MLNQVAEAAKLLIVQLVQKSEFADGGGVEREQQKRIQDLERKGSTWLKCIKKERAPNQTGKTRLQKDIL